MAKKTGAYEAPTPASDKKKALDTALSQIEKSFGKGAVMRLGDRPEMNVEAYEAPTPASDKKKALDTALSQIEKSFGKGAVMRLGDRPEMNVEAIPTGSLALDAALGIGGVPKGRIIEIYGPESSGKTTLALHILAEAQKQGGEVSLALDAALGIGGVPKGRIIEIYGPESSGKTTLALHILAEAQKQGGEVAFVDAEHALDPVYAAALGVDTDNMLVSQPDTGEQALEITDALVRSGAVDAVVVDSVAALTPRAEIVDTDNMLVSQPDTGEQALEITDALVRSGAVDAVVVDSVAALTPRAEIEGEMGDTFVGLQARLMSQALRKLAGTISKTNCVVIFINQLRMKIGVMYGNPETTTGGNALKFYASVRLDVRRVESIKEGGNVIGNKTRVKVVKNKVAPPFREAHFDIMYGQGIAKWGELVDLAVQLDIVQKSGSWFSMGDERIGQGKESVKAYLQSNPEIADRVEQEVRDNMYKLMGGAARPQAKPAEKAVAVSADDFNDED